ncbi:MAG: lipoprotein [Methylophilus sp.]
MRHLLLKCLSLILFVTCLSACGTKGSLYIPEQRYPQETPQKN